MKNKRRSPNPPSKTGLGTINTQGKLYGAQNILIQ
jgi:hypothetical protein